MSTTATSGRWIRIAASRPGPSPAWATTSNPASTTRRQHDQRRRTIIGEFARDLEALYVREPDVEQQHIRAKRPRRRQTRSPVDRLADDIEPVGRQDRPRLDAEARVVVDDEDRVHADIVARQHPSAYRVTPDHRATGTP
jgi:hypothetical protein